MKATLVVIVLAACAFAQENSEGKASAACGPLNVKFVTDSSTAQPLGQPDPSKALVYVVEDFRKAPGEWGNPTIRVGLDGAWEGATRASSYLAFAVDPGEHHLCASWQSHQQRLSKLAAFAHLMAEAGKTYYYRARITYSSYGGNVANMNLDLEPVDRDQGENLVASYHPSDSHPKK
jgi:hypothetical protein